jgi:alpha-1,3-mannosyl-glycoprotein beta-1,2-N-acetylglucosaminyltransferase
MHTLPPARARAGGRLPTAHVLVPAAILFLIQLHSVSTVLSTAGPPQLPRQPPSLASTLTVSDLGSTDQWSVPVFAVHQATPPMTQTVSVGEHHATGAPTDTAATTTAASGPALHPMLLTPRPSIATPRTVAPPTDVVPLVLERDTAPTSLVALKNAALVVLCYNRPELLTKTLQRITKTQLASSIKKYVSQDGDELDTQAVAQSFDHFEYMSHPRTLPPVIRLNSSMPDRQTKETPGTMYLAAHYKWVLDKLLLEKGHTHAIIVEDDLSVSSDFLLFFEQLAPLLEADPTLWCVSTWNDNGFGDRFTLPPDGVLRSSFFPGLGWMLRRELWQELSPKFPTDNWDHWMRVSTTHKGRSCLVPFLSRNRNMGESGATANAEFFEAYLKNVASLKDSTVKAQGVPVIRHPARLIEATYDAELHKAIAGAEVVEGARAALSADTFRPGKRYVVPYVSEDFETIAQLLRVHPTPRTNYKGVTWIQLGPAHVFLLDRRRSPFAPEELRLERHASLKAIRSSQTNENCIETCRVYGMGFGETWTCGDDQFDYINDCEELAKNFGGCPYGCTQGWGEDIPNMESWDVGTNTPQCLVTEMRPRCAASHPLTTRLCPCINTARAAQKAKRLHGLVAVAAARADDSCVAVCMQHKQDPNFKTARYQCDESQFDYISSCKELQAHFPCTACIVNTGADLPNYVSREGDPNHGKCLLAASQPTCTGSHVSSRRLCPCVPLGGLS